MLQAKSVGRDRTPHCDAHRRRPSSWGGDRRLGRNHLPPCNANRATFVRADVVAAGETFRNLAMPLATCLEAELAFRHLAIPIATVLETEIVALGEISSRLAMPNACFHRLAIPIATGPRGGNR